MGFGSFENGMNSDIASRQSITDYFAFHACYRDENTAWYFACRNSHIFHPLNLRYDRSFYLACEGQFHIFPKKSDICCGHGIHNVCRAYCCYCSPEIFFSLFSPAVFISVPIVLVTILFRLLDSTSDGRPFCTLLGRPSLRLNEKPGGLDFLTNHIFKFLTI